MKQQIFSKASGISIKAKSPERFRLNSQELEMIGMALNHYTKYLRQQHPEKAKQAKTLDNRIFAFLQSQKTSVTS